MVRKRQRTATASAAPEAINLENVLGRLGCLKILAQRTFDRNRTTFVHNSDSFLRSPESLRRYHFCWVGKTSIDTNTGYVRQRLSSNDPSSTTRPNVLIHLVSFFAVSGSPPFGTASHLCGNNACYNPFHVRDESLALNVKRNYCKGVLVCPHHQHIVYDDCNCTPKCISSIRDKSAFSCCLHLSPSPELSSDTPGPHTEAIEPPEDEDIATEDEELIGTLHPRMKKVLTLLGKIEFFTGSKTGQKYPRLYNTPLPTSEEPTAGTESINTVPLLTTTATTATITVPIRSSPPPVQHEESESDDDYSDISDLDDLPVDFDSF